jgi:hypothetical protein
MPAKITMEIARQIRADFKRDMPTVRTHDGTITKLRLELAARYGLSERTLSDILGHRSWKEPEK